ncbi:MAG: CDP-alcohol phosphatidyltransferase family protein [Candidatus Heimdallarchaeota archaeon]|nr:CDP-alcohol phosphatidyltransferase family protein [Candidatus Heimdallarchaeota archaeon]
MTIKNYENNSHPTEESPIEESPKQKKWEPPEFPKILRIFFAILANFITFLNFASGIIAIILVTIDPRNYVYAIWAAKLVLLGIIFDFSDGIPARLAKKKPGFFGTVVDSAADTVTFGLAPAVMISLSLPVLSPLSNAHFILAIFSIIIGCYFGFCTIFRLIRFTKSPSKKWFKGIPSPGAGCAAAIYIIIKLFIEQKHSTGIATPIIGLILMILTGTMMIVTIKYPTTKLRKNYLEIFLLGLAAVTIIAVVATPFNYIIYPAALMGGLTIFYVLYGPFYLLKHMLERAKEVEDY